MKKASNQADLNNFSKWLLASFKNRSDVIRTRSKLAASALFIIFLKNRVHFRVH